MDAFEGCIGMWVLLQLELEEVAYLPACFFRMNTSFNNNKYLNIEIKNKKPQRFSSHTHIEYIEMCVNYGRTCDYGCCCSISWSSPSFRRRASGNCVFLWKINQSIDFPQFYFLFDLYSGWRWFLLNCIPYFFKHLFHLFYRLSL